MKLYMAPHLLSDRVNRCRNLSLGRWQTEVDINPAPLSRLQDSLAGKVS